MKISVCMCTYNGEKYIEEQLESILQQTVKPDEVILCDDNSTDRTVEIIESFLNKNDLRIKWKLYQNTENKGYPGNFYYAMSLCTGGIVFLADQDDIWNVNKIETMLRVFNDYEEAKVVCCKFALIDEMGGNIHTLMAPTRSKGTMEIRKVTIADVFYKCEWPGMVLAYRNEWYQGIGNVMVGSGTPHDFLLCAKAAEEKGFLQLDKCLAYHRRHENNAGGEEHRFRRLLDKQRKEREISDYLCMLKDISERRVLLTTEGNVKLQRKIELMKARYAALQSGKMGEVLKNWYASRKEVRLATLICDMLIVKR